MKRLTLTFGIAAASVLQGEGAGGSGTLPPTLVWSSTGCHIEFDHCAQLEFCEGSNGVFGYRNPGVSSCSATTAPLIRMHPGLKYELILKNTASKKTNLHPHGLHLSGDGNGDDITRHAEPGECLFYNWTIAEDHMGGTNWYHSHIHGLSHSQVDGGAFGQLIIEDPSSYAEDLDVQSWMAKDLVLSAYLDLSGNILGNGGVQTFDVVADSWYRLRILTVDPAALANTVYFEKCEFRQVAADGIYFNTIPHSQVTEVVMSGAGRADFAVKCSDSGGNIKWRGTAASNLIAEFNIVSGSADSASPFKSNTQWSPVRPEYVVDLRNAQVDATQDLTMSGNAINQIPWDADVPPYSFRYNDVQEWSLFRTAGHPFHLHIHHMQIVTPGGCGPFLEGEWYDTITAKGMGQSTPCKVRFRMIDFSGRTVLHCHVLAHEDQGAMIWVNIIGGPPVVGKGTPATCSLLSSCQASSCSLIDECGSNMGIDNCGNPCTAATNGTCSTDEVCFHQLCKSTADPECVSSSDCPNGQDCKNNQCTLSSSAALRISWFLLALCALPFLHHQN